MSQVLSKTQDYGLYIGGKYVQPEGAPRLPVTNPATGETWATIVNARAQDVDEAVRTARAAFDTTWSMMPPSARVRLLHRLADMIEARARELAEIEVRDNGKLLREMYAQLKAIPKRNA